MLVFNNIKYTEKFSFLKIINDFTKTTNKRVFSSIFEMLLS